MALRGVTPWWVSLALLSGLVFLFLGQRELLGGAIATYLGLALIMAVLGFRVWAFVVAKGAIRRAARTILLCHVGVVVALAIYWLSTRSGLALLGMKDPTTKTAVQAAKMLTVGWSIVLLASLLPLLFIELAQSSARDIASSGHAAEAEAGIDDLRVREASWSGLSIALAAALMMVTCNVANERNVRRDVSYFKTSAPGPSTVAMVNTSDEKLKVLLFFPEINEVKDEVRGYFETLAVETGRIEIEEHDRLLSAKLAADYKVTKEGSVVLVRGKSSETFDVDTSFEMARRGRSKLRNLDKLVNEKLLKLVRKKRTAYLTIGHGEINDPQSLAPEMRGRVQERRTAAMRQRLLELNYEVKDLGLVDLAVDVPDDATLVIVAGPTHALATDELTALDRYLEKGGRVLLAVEPTSQATLGPLEARLGYSIEPSELTNDKVYLRVRNNPSDRRWTMTNQISAHASVTATQRSADAGVLFIGAGALRELPLQVDAGKTKRTIVIRALESSFLDVNNNFEFDAATEKRDRYNLVAAVEGPSQKDGEGKDKDGWRAVVVADADVFADLVEQSQMGISLTMPGRFLLDDTVKWLGGEEVLSGAIISEEDIALKHTADQDNKWFLATIGGAPLLVLGVGLTYTNLRRRRRRTTRPTRATTGPAVAADDAKRDDDQSGDQKDGEP